MPEISRFFGIVITMYYRDHGPPHFHARYAGFKATIRVADGVIEGKLPKRAEAMVLEWWNIHREEIAANWRRAENGESLKAIEPLE